MIEFSGYRISEQIYNGSRTLVYRGIRTSDDKPVVIKLMRAEYPSFSELVQFRNQYAIAKKLDLRGIVKPLALETYGNGYALIMENRGDISLAEYGQRLRNSKPINLVKTGLAKVLGTHSRGGGKTHLEEDFRPNGISPDGWGTKKTPLTHSPLPIVDFLAIAIQLAETLNGLYQNRVIHKDIKPANILIHPDTKQVKLIDFSISSLLPRETQEIHNPNVLEGTLAYISPEQTGRMNRGIDYRTDFYSLGVTFYELLTGELPFQSDDPMELVHCHLAQPPIFPHGLPSTVHNLLEIVMKLMAKNAENRYQSALGLKYDLEKCLYQWKETGKIESFELGKRDICDRFVIPEKLYGREAEVGQLLAAFDRVASPRENPVVVGPKKPIARGQEDQETRGQGETSPNLTGSELMLVAGFSGIGKTAVVNEVHKPIVRQQGYFIKGKFDQFNRNIPFSAFVQAFRDLMGQLLSESDTKLQQWKTQILRALGENAQVIIDVIPELQNIIGKQPTVPELSGSAAQNRFNLLFLKFIQVFTTKEHPLVLFLDDLQWADSASLKLMELLLSETVIGYLLLIGAYRDNEVFPAHPLMLTLDEIQKTKAAINTIALSPLTPTDVNHLVADTLCCSEKLAQPLTELVARKTKGNPFFATQFLKSLYEDGLIWFNFEVNHWQCDIAQVKALSLTDDVVKFMALQLQKLPQNTQDVLKLAACIGNQFDLETLAIVSEYSPEETASQLWKALQDGLILPQSEVYKFFQAENDGQSQTEKITHQSPIYKFLHDRVQQAAYSLIPEDSKKETHLKVGQLLLSKTDDNELKNRIFDIVNQLNIGVELITESNEREQLANLNLIAGRKAKNSTAYGAAVGYLRTGIQLLTFDCWKNQYDLTIALYELAAEAEYLIGKFNDSNTLIEITLKQAQSTLDKVKTYEIKIQSCVAQNQFITAIKAGQEALNLLGVDFPDDCDFETTLAEQEGVKNSLGDRQIEELANLPELSNTNQGLALRILSGLFAPVYIAKPMLLPLKIFTMVKICIQSGNSPQAAIAYSLYGLFLCGIGEIDAGYRFGKLALKMLEKFQAKELKSRVYLTFSLFIKHWKDSVGSALEFFLEGLKSGLETGNLEYVGYCANCYSQFLFWTGTNLDFAESEANKYCDLMQDIKQDVSLIWGNTWRQTVQNLQGKAENPRLLIGSCFDETEMLPFLIENRNINGICYVYLAKLLLSYYLGDSKEAIQFANQFEYYQNGAAGLLIIPLKNFYQSLSLLSSQTRVDRDDKKIEENQIEMKKWANFAPGNYQHKFNLIEAEKFRVLGQKLEAIELYDRAIAGAKENDYLQEEALANELAGKFYLDWGKENIAKTYIIEAYYCYARWGAKAKTDNLETCYPQLLAPILNQEQSSPNIRKTLALNSTKTVTNSSTSSLLDLTTAIKASQTLSEEIELEKLFSKLMQTVLENAGADKGLLVLNDRGSWRIVAQGIGETCDLSSHCLESSPNLPLSVIHWVKRSHQVALINEVYTDKNFAADLYFLQHQPKSLLCLPILNQTKLLGILYLENNLTAGAFTADRLEVLTLLCSQAAISLENAQLYQDVQASNKMLQKSLKNLKSAQLQLVQSEKMATIGQLLAGITHEINNPVSFISGNLTHAQEYTKDTIGLLKLYQKHYPNPVSEIEDEIEAIELDYLIEDLPQLLGSMEEGTKRIQEISHSMRTFSRSDHAHKVPFNLHEGIDSTLLILKHRLKANDRRPDIEIIKDYGNLPPVTCYPGQLNQVFMNLLANAIDALEEANAGLTFKEIQKNLNQITIRTEILADTNHVAIQIEDNGLGMPEEVRQKIFDHLFTTKPVGKGTGLGLSISHQIVVEKHGGQLRCLSSLGQGTQFCIKIPVHG